MTLLTTHQRMTAREFAALPEGPPHFQLVEGELFVMASPNRRRQKIVLRAAFRIEEYLRARPIGEVYVAPSDVELNEKNVFEPDIYYVSRERSGILTDQGATGAPDLVVEILSPSTARIDLETKRQVYLRAGVRELWFVWPSRAEVAVHVADGGDGTGSEKVFGRGDQLSTPLLAGWKIAVAELFD